MTHSKVKLSLCCITSNFERPERFLWHIRLLFRQLSGQEACGISESLSTETLSMHSKHGPLLHSYLWRSSQRPAAAAMCKLLMSKRADKREGEIARSPPPPSVSQSLKKAHIIITCGVVRLWLCQRKMSSKKNESAVPTFFVFSLCLLALAVAGEFL